MSSYELIRVFPESPVPEVGHNIEAATDEDAVRAALVHLAGVTVVTRARLVRPGLPPDVANFERIDGRWRHSV